jgi:hypothetical protein
MGHIALHAGIGAILASGCLGAAGIQGGPAAAIPGCPLGQADWDRPLPDAVAAIDVARLRACQAADYVAALQAILVVHPLPIPVGIQPVAEWVFQSDPAAGDSEAHVYVQWAAGGDAARAVGQAGLLIAGSASRQSLLVFAGSDGKADRTIEGQCGPLALACGQAEAHWQTPASPQGAGRMPVRFPSCGQTGSTAVLDAPAPPDWPSPDPSTFGSPWQGRGQCIALGVAPAGAGPGAGPCPPGEVGSLPACAPLAGVLDDLRHIAQRECAGTPCLSDAQNRFMNWPEGPAFAGGQGRDPPPSPPPPPVAPLADAPPAAPAMAAHPPDGLAGAVLAEAGRAQWSDGGAPPLRCGQNRAHPACTLLVVHGYPGDRGPEKEDVGPYFANVARQYQAVGFTVHRVSYYGGECGADEHAEGEGPTVGPYAGEDPHSMWGGKGDHQNYTGCDALPGSGIHTRNTAIAHLAFHLAWSIYNHYTSKGIPVDIVAHSMGGLIVRMAVHQSGSGDPAWPPRLLVDSVVSYGTPFNGAKDACLAWASVVAYGQLREMCAWSRLLNYLRAEAQDLPGHWVLIGSGSDGYVEGESAVDMDGAHYYAYGYGVTPGDGGRQGCGGYGHADYFGAGADGSALDACYLYDVTSLTRNLYQKGKGTLQDLAYRPIRLGLLEAVT